jgi:hypothetical protein
MKVLPHFTLQMWLISRMACTFLDLSQWKHIHLFMGITDQLQPLFSVTFLPSFLTLAFFSPNSPFNPYLCLRSPEERIRTPPFHKARAAT